MQACINKYSTIRIQGLPNVNGTCNAVIQAAQETAHIQYIRLYAADSTSPHIQTYAIIKPMGETKEPIHRLLSRFKPPFRINGQSFFPKVTVRIADHNDFFSYAYEAGEIRDTVVAKYHISEFAGRPFISRIMIQRDGSESTYAMWVHEKQISMTPVKCHERLINAKQLVAQQRLHLKGHTQIASEVVFTKLESLASKSTLLEDVESLDEGNILQASPDRNIIDETLGGNDDDTPTLMPRCTAVAVYRPPVASIYRRILNRTRQRTQQRIHAVAVRCLFANLKLERWELELRSRAIHYDNEEEHPFRLKSLGDYFSDWQAFFCQRQIDQDRTAFALQLALFEDEDEERIRREAIVVSQRRLALENLMPRSQTF